MTGLVKNQIAKQLARFTKNLSPNKISVKFLKGEGELHNLELDETTLSELLELPPWIRLTKAVCNRISAKIHWTRLKTDPICLYLDCVEISMEAIEADAGTPPPRSPQTRPPTAPPQPIKEKAPNRYGFVEKVVDGMYVQINSAIISFKFQAFLATFQMSRLLIQSTTPKWQPDDLRSTRVKDEARGEVLTFKQITWQTLRIDANALYDDKLASQRSTPLRLITSHSALHITIKKRLEDCAVLSARLELLLDDILWVLTQSQLQALSGLFHSVTEAMSRTADMKGSRANVSPPAGQATQQPPHYTSSNTHDKKSDFESLNALFTQNDVRETSYHIRTGSIDLHLCDDSGQGNSDGGAMHFQINKLSIDHYPYHLAGTSRTDWPSHNEASLTRAYWVGQLLNAFRNSVRNKQPDARRASQTLHRARSDSSFIGSDGRDGQQQPPTPPSPSLSPRTNSKSTSGASPRHSQSAHSMKNNTMRPVFMLESCFVIRCEEFFIMPVSTCNLTRDGTAFLSSDKKALYLPSDMSAFQIDFTQYYYPGSVGSPVPCPNLFIQMNPIQLTLDTATCLWLSRFARSVLGERTWTTDSSGPPTPPSKHIDIRIEALMPKVTIPCPSDPSLHYKDSRPQALQLQASQVFITNTRTGYKSSQTDLLMFLQPFMGSKVYTDFMSFPSCSDDVRPLPNTAWVNDCSVLPNNFKMEKMLNGMHNDAFGTHQASQVWCILAEQAWLDFLGIDESKNRPMPFVDAVPVQIWIATPLPVYDPINRTANMTAKNPREPVHANSVRHGRSASEVIPHKTLLHRKAFEPLSPPLKTRADTASAFLSPSSSDPNLRTATSLEPPAGVSLDGPPPAYEPHRNGTHRPDPAVSEPPPPYETLRQNGPHLSGTPFHGASLSQDDLNGLPATGTQSGQELDLGPKASVSLLVNIPECASVILDHFQFVFLMRLQEMLVKLQEDLERDETAPDVNDSKRNNDGDALPAVFFSVVTQGVNLSIVLPPALDSDVSRPESQPSQSTSRNVSSLSSYVDSGLVSDGGCQSPDVAEPKSNSSTERTTESEEAAKGKASPSIDSKDVSASDEPSRPCSSQSVSHASGRASASSTADSDGWLVVTPGETKSGASSVPSRRDSNTSNISSQFESSSSKDSSNKEAAKNAKDSKMVSILSIEGEGVDFGIHLHGPDQVVKVVCPEVRIEELGAVNFEKFLNRKSFKKSLTKSTLPPSSETTPMVRVRAEFGPSAERNEPTAGERGFARVKVHGLCGSLLMSTLESLSECFEDEVVLPPMPFIVEAENSSITINNDTPPRLLSAPLSIPVDLNVDNISIQRTHDGVFHVSPLGLDPTTPEEDSGEPVSMAMARQESINASQLSLSDSASVSSRAESLENEKQCLVAQMSVSRAALQSLQEERDAFLKTIERLQQELSFSNREQDRLQEKMANYQKGGRKAHR